MPRSSASEPYDVDEPVESAHEPRCRSIWWTLTRGRASFLCARLAVNEHGSTCNDVGSSGKRIAACDGFGASGNRIAFGGGVGSVGIKPVSASVRSSAWLRLAQTGGGVLASDELHRDMSLATASAHGATSNEGGGDACPPTPPALDVASSLVRKLSQHLGAACASEVVLVSCMPSRVGTWLGIMLSGSTTCRGVGSCAESAHHDGPLKKRRNATLGDHERGVTSLSSTASARSPSRPGCARGQLDGSQLPPNAPARAGISGAPSATAAAAPAAEAPAA